MTELDAVLDRIADLLGFLDEIEKADGPNPTPEEIRSFFRPAGGPTVRDALEAVK